MSHQFDEKWPFSGPNEDGQEQLMCQSTTERSPNLSSEDEKWPSTDTIEDEHELSDMVFSEQKSLINKYITEEDKSKVLCHIKIVEDLIDEAILELCFETHRIAKLCPVGITQVFEKPKKSIMCYLCKQTKGHEKFTTHYVDCFNKLDGVVTNRKAKAKANNNFKEYEAENDDDDDDDGRGKKSKKGARGKPKPTGNSSSKQSYNSPKYEDMSNEEKKKFLEEKCGVVTKRGKKRCMNKPTCTVHSLEEKDNVRYNFLREMNDETECEEVDVDTINEKDTTLMPSYSVVGDESTPMLLADYSGSSAFS